jgi:Kef-type K+ transport system membrane component KefB
MRYQLDSAVAIKEKMHYTHPVFIVILAALFAPLLAEIRVGFRVPVVVFEVILGVLIGPHLLNLASPNEFFEMMKSFGTAAVMFMAGMEFDFRKISGRPLSLAVQGWVVSLMLALLLVGVLHVIPAVNAPMMVAIALTTTGLGTMLPILRDGGQLDSPFGRLVQATGTVGEIAPMVAVSLTLSQRFSSGQEFGFLLVFLMLVGLAVAVGTGLRPPKVIAFLGRTMHSSTQMPIRLALALMIALYVLSQDFGFEGIFGAFAAGMIVGLTTRGEDSRDFRIKIDAICFGFLSPFLFIGTGLQFELGALARDATSMILMPTFLLLFLVVRGGPVFLYRKEMSLPESWSFALSSSVTSLGLVVVITQIGLHTKSMSQDIAQALIAASLLSLLLFPALAGALLAKDTPSIPPADPR